MDHKKTRNDEKRKDQSLNSNPRGTQTKFKKVEKCKQKKYNVDSKNIVKC